MQQEIDTIINFVGAGDPARLKAMAGDILPISHHYDALALSYLQRHPQTRYIFLSSGAVYGHNFQQPVTDESPAVVPANAIKSQDYYTIAKLYAETIHRSLKDLSIVDVRVFNYFSRAQNLESRFFISDIINAIVKGVTLESNAAPMTRDYIHPTDFVALIECLLDAEPCNTAVDCYSREPITKTDLLATMQNEFGLKYTMNSEPNQLNATGEKPFYYSLNRAAQRFGYHPIHTSKEALIDECRAILLSIPE